MENSTDNNRTRAIQRTTVSGNTFDACDVWERVEIRRIYRSRWSRPAGVVERSRKNYARNKLSRRPVAPDYYGRPRPRRVNSASCRNRVYVPSGTLRHGILVGSEAALNPPAND
jgi:hypothetical protein